VDYFDLQRAAAERVLRQLQEHPDTWTRVVAVLQNSQNLNSKFYALRVRIDYQVWNLLPKVEMHSLKTVDCSKLLHCQTVFGPALAFSLAVWLLMLSIQVLEGVIKYRWNALPVEQRDGIKNYISDLIVQVSFCNICIMP
jgi:exportin-1